MTSPHIAIVDDDPLFAEYLSLQLSALGYDTITFNSGASLFSAMDAPGARAFDAIVLDVLMPEPGGIHTLRQLRSAQPQIPVVMLSGQDVPATIVETVKLGAADYLVKSEDVSALATSLRRAMATIVGEEESQVSAAVDTRFERRSDLVPGRAMRGVLEMVDRIADSDISVLLTGESGVGKEVVARELHQRSPRRTRPFVKINCAALPAELLESELFGHERGAFTGAQTTRVGKFEFADGGVLMLDEIGEMPLGLQAKLLHVLQDSTITRLGSNRVVPVDVRIIAATNRDLQAMIRDGRFRLDLYYRLQVIEIPIPPLRARRDEILPLAGFFLARDASRYRRAPIQASAALRSLLLDYPWPGNVRELENAMRRFVILRDEGLLRAQLTTGPIEPASSHVHAPAELRAPEPAPSAWTPRESSDARLPVLARAAALTAERDAIQRALDQLRWNRRKAARHLGVSYKTLLHKMKECGITAPDQDGR